MLKRSLPRLRAVAVVSMGAALATPAVAAAGPPAPGAPGAVHTWAPADKHGFATAHQLAGNAYLTLRSASLSEVRVVSAACSSRSATGAAGSTARRWTTTPRTSSR